jgi:hypothetical protein
VNARCGYVARVFGAAAIAVCAGCISTTGPAPTTVALPTKSSQVASPTSPYEQAVDAAHARGLEVWLEADLAKRWLAGPDAFQAGVDALGRLASRPGVVGIKIADELGYEDGFDRDPVAMVRFLSDTRQALATAAAGKLLLMDLVIPSLGCHGSGAADCASQADARFPALSLDRLDDVFRERLVDAVDISTGLLDEATYERWGTTRADAQAAAWAEIDQRGWQNDVRLQARKAFAHTGSYTGTADDAEADAHLFLDLPLEAGATAVDVWAWHQPYRGDIVRLMDPGLASNAMWDALRRRRDVGDRLYTHFTPSSVEVSLDTDLDVLEQVFTGVFLAAGIG